MSDAQPDQVPVYLPDPPLLAPVAPIRAEQYRPPLIAQRDPDLPDLHEQPITVPAETLARWEQALAAYEQVQDEIRQAKAEADRVNEQALLKRAEQVAVLNEQRDRQAALARIAQQRADEEFWGAPEFRVVDRHAYNGEAWSSNTRDLGSTLHRDSCRLLDRVKEPSQVLPDELRWDQALQYIFTARKTQAAATYDTRTFKVCKTCSRDLDQRISLYERLSIDLPEAMTLEQQKPTNEQIETLAALYLGSGGDRTKLLLIA